MKPRYAWLLSCGLAGVCLVASGCGGGDVPNPEADSNAAGPPPAAAPAPAPPVVAQADSGPPAAPDGEAKPAPEMETKAAPETEAKGAPEPAETVTPVDEGALLSSKGDAAKPGDPASAEAKGDEAKGEMPAKSGDSGATADLLALGNRSAPAEAAATPAAAADGATPGAPGADPATAGPGVAAAGGATPAPATETAAAEPPAGAPAAGNEPPAADDGGGFAGGGGGAMSNVTGYHSPFGAVNTFLKALKSRNAEKLAESTARRAPTEAAAKNQKLFASILEQSLTDDDLNELANKLEGFNIADHNTPKSTGRYSIILMKPDKSGARYVRTIYTRHEKDGWKVYDISGLGKLEKPMMNMRGRGGMRGVGGRRR